MRNRKKKMKYSKQPSRTAGAAAAATTTTMRRHSSIQTQKTGLLGRPRWLAVVGGGAAAAGRVVDSAQANVHTHAYTHTHTRMYA